MGSTAESSPSSELSSTSLVSLIVLMGLPGSGKSSLVTRLLNYFQNKEIRLHVVAFDTFVPLPFQVQLYETASNSSSESGSLTSGKIVRKKFVECVTTIIQVLNKKDSINIKDELEALEEKLCSLECSSTIVPISNQIFVEKTKDILVEICNNLLNEKTAILVDDNNYYSSMRNDYYQIAKLNQIGFCVVHCKAPVEICVSRNSKRAEELQVPDKVIREMNKKLEEPNALLNPCDMYCVEVRMLDEDEVNMELLERIVLRGFENPLKRNEDRSEEVERERKICSENEVHQADLHLRKWISKKLTLASFSNLDKLGKRGGFNQSSEGKKHLAKELAIKKRHILEGLRSGQFQVSWRVEQDVEFREEIIGLFEKFKL